MTDTVQAWIGLYNTFPALCKVVEAIRMDTTCMWSDETGLRPEFFFLSGLGSRIYMSWKTRTISRRVFAKQTIMDVFGEDHPYIRRRLDLVTTTIDSLSEYGRAFRHAEVNGQTPHEGLISIAYLSPGSLWRKFTDKDTISRDSLITWSHISIVDFVDYEDDSTKSSATHFNLRPKFTPCYGTRYMCDSDAPTLVVPATGKISVSD
ncbi:hypothetical protein DFS33DRAFT_1272491 [Desarmillaria ectypa]|nr:hypothetical protein DFS33DRAFT_1272491 [Desarmillaria ectypa]